MLREISRTCKRYLWHILYRLLRGRIRYELHNREKLEELLRGGRPIVFVIHHRNVTSFLSYLLDQRGPRIGGLARLVMMMADSPDASDALRFVKNPLIPVHVIPRPAFRRNRRTVTINRGNAFRNFLRAFRESPNGTVAVITTDERLRRRERRLSNGAAILLASKCDAVVVPISARNSFELTMEGSWDKHRIPLSGGKIMIGEPFEVRKGSGKIWRCGEAARMEAALCALDSDAERLVRTARVPP